MYCAPRFSCRAFIGGIPIETSNRLTEGSIVGKILYFAWPVFLGNLFQQLYNVADTLIVGNLLGNRALAAVSSTGSLVFLIVHLFSGISLGAGVVISRYFGARDIKNMRIAVHTDITFGVISGLVVSVGGALFARQFLIWMQSPINVLDLSAEYLSMYFAGAISLVLYNTCTGIMQAVGDSRHPLQYLIISSCLNVVLDIVMIKAFDMGVRGAAAATVISQSVSVILCFIRLFRVKDSYRLSMKEMKLSLRMLILLLKYGLPSGLQNSIISIANIVVQSNINVFGEMAMAGCGAYSKVEGFAFLPIISFTSALTTFVGQNLGAKEYERAKKGARFGLTCCIIISEIIGVIIFILAPLCMRAFTDEPEAIAIGVERSHICVLFYCVLACSHAIASILRGAGRAIVPMITMIVIWCGIRVSILAITMPYVNDVAMVGWVYPITWTLSSIVLFLYYIKADWIHAFDRDAARRSRP